MPSLRNALAPATAGAAAASPSVCPEVTCSQCSLRVFCMPAGLTPGESAQVDTLVAGRRKVRRGGVLFYSGEPFEALYAIRSGVFKTRIAAGDGRDQVTGFHVSGDILGLDGLARQAHHGDAVALEDAEVCVMPFDRMTELARSVPALQHHLHRVMGREIVRENGLLLLLGNTRAEERLASFLLDLAQRLHARGFSPSEMVLRMTRHEIGSYLGLKLETVSRTFSKFAGDGLLEVHQRHIRILDADALRRLVKQPDCG